MATGPGPRHTFPTRFTAIKFGGGNTLIISLDIGGFNGTFNTLRNATKFSVAPQDKVNTGQVSWSGTKGISIAKYFKNELEFNTRKETLVFNVPVGSWNLAIKAYNAIEGGNATAAIYSTKAKGLSIYDGEKLSDIQGNTATLSQPVNIQDSNPPEVDPSSIVWGFPSSFVIPSGAENIPDAKINGMWVQYGVNQEGIHNDLPTHGDYDDVVRWSKADSGNSNMPDRNWKRVTKFYQPGSVSGYETVIKYADGFDPGENGEDIEWTLYVTFKAGKLKISNKAPPPPPPPA